MVLLTDSSEFEQILVAYNQRYEDKLYKIFRRIGVRFAQQLSVRL